MSLPEKKIVRDQDDQVSLKKVVRNYWDEETCGVRYGQGNTGAAFFQSIRDKRYDLIPYIEKFAGFEHAGGKDLLEIGVGAGTDFENWVKHGARAHGIDLTQSAIDITRKRLEHSGFDTSKIFLSPGDAENLQFDSNMMDIVWSWGVLMHTPDTAKAFTEVFRVLKPGGVFRGMIYAVPSWTGWLLWCRHCLAKGQFFRNSRWAIYNYLESPGTKAYSNNEIRNLLQGIGFSNIELQRRLSPSDLLNFTPSKKYNQKAFRLISTIYPRQLIQLSGNRFGFNLLVEARKPLDGVGR